MIINWIKTGDVETLIYGLMFIFVTSTGGLILGQYPQRVKVFFGTPIGQFIVMFFVYSFLTKYNTTIKIQHIVLEAIIAVVILRVVMWLSSTKN